MRRSSLHNMRSPERMTRKRPLAVQNRMTKRARQIAQAVSTRLLKKLVMGVRSLRGRGVHVLEPAFCGLLRGFYLGRLRRWQP